jgi:hypothetical protein
MAQTYTLEEAADKLNLSVEEFKRRLRSEWTQVRSFRDGTTLRFRANEIDELARTIGLGSSEELPLADGSDPEFPHDKGHSSTKLKKAPAPDDDAPLKLDDSDEMFLITPEPPKAPSSKKLKSKSDSDVRLEKAKKKAADEADDEESILTEEMDLPSAGGSGKLSGKSGKLSSAKLKSESGKLKAGDSGKAQAAPKPADDSSSEFELSLDADSDEFELSLAPDSSEEVSLGDMPAEPKGKGGQSGINLNRPADSGVSLEKRRTADEEDSEIDFELSLETPGSGASSKKLGSSKKLQADSDSEFELTLEEPSDLSLEATGEVEKKGDIFEATDFEIPALEDDSASEAVSLDEADTDLESSDFDLALDEDDAVADDESASEVVELDEEEVSAAKSKLKGKKKKKKKVVDDDDDEGEVDLDDAELEAGSSASAALRGVRHEDEDEYDVAADDDDDVRPARAAKWGVFPALLMFPTVIVMFLGGIMAYEMLHSVWGYQQSNKPTTPLVSWFADKLNMKPAAQ